MATVTLTPDLVCEASDWEWVRFKEETDFSNQISGCKNGRIGVALIGLGRMGLIHLRNLLRETRAKPLYCFDSDSSRLAACAKTMFFDELGIKALPSDNYNEALKDPEVKAIIIATPTCFHEQYTKLALKAGKNVLCEKPLTLKTDEIVPLYQLAKENKVFLMCGFNRRYDPDFKHLHKRTRERDSLGSLQLIKITARDCQRPPLSYVRVSGGLFHDTAIHDIDMCLWLARQLPVSIQVMGKTWKEYFKNEPSLMADLSVKDRELLQEIDDFFLAVITMKFPDGSIGMIDNSRKVNYGYDQRCEIYGSNGMLKTDGRRSLNVKSYGELGIIHSNINYSFASRYNAAYQNELRDLLTMSELADSDLYDNQFAISARLLEPYRPTLVAATHKVADACLAASKSGQVMQLDWLQNFKEQFEFEIEL